MRGLRFLSTFIFLLSLCLPGVEASFEMEKQVIETEVSPLGETQNGNFDVIKSEKKRKLEIRVHMHYYGGEANEENAKKIQREIYREWNRPRHTIVLDGEKHLLRFTLTWDILTEDQVLDLAHKNENPRHNFARIEQDNDLSFSFSKSFDNSGFFRVVDINSGNKTIAHEFGHFLGLIHNHNQDFRGETGPPSIMATPQAKVDPQYASIGETIDMSKRVVTESDLQKLRAIILSRNFDGQNVATFGETTNELYQ